MRPPRLINFKIKSLNLGKVFELLRKAQIDVFDVKSSPNKETIFSLQTKNVRAAKKILARAGVHIQNAQPRGLSRLKHFCIVRCGVVAGVILSLALYITSSFFVLKIEIAGTQTLSKDQVQSFLATQSIHAFCSKSQIEEKRLETALLQNFPELSMASIAVRGLTLYVNLKEKASLDESQSKNIIANFDGRIKEISVISGKALVKKGSLVKKGDVLVQADTNASISAVAKANIVAEVWATHTISHSEKQVQKVRTGNSQTFRRIEAFGLEIFKSSPAQNFQMFEEESSITLIKNLSIPLAVYTITQYELLAVARTVPFDSVKDKILAECKQIALQKLLNNDIIESEKVFTAEVAGTWQTTCTVIATRNIF